MQLNQILFFYMPKPFFYYLMVFMKEYSIQLTNEIGKKKLYFSKFWN